MTTPRVPRAGVAGWPVAHSRSPLIHGYWLETLGLPGRYERFPVPPGEFAAFAATIGVDGLLGANVTVPHKENAYAACDRLTEVAKALGAVNTLWRAEGFLWGDNTDVTGFLANLDESAPGWAERSANAVVVGAGGAARAIVYGLLARGVAEINIVNRTASRAQTLAAHFGAKVRPASWRDLPALLARTDLLVNASSLGMTGQPPLAIDLTAMRGRAIVADIVYAPLRTQLVVAARAQGLTAVEGLGMLLHQAAPAFARWFGVTPMVTPQLRAIIERDVEAAIAEKEKPS